MRRTAASSLCADSIPKPAPASATTSCTMGRSCRLRPSSAAPFSMMSASSTSHSASARTPNSVCARGEVVVLPRAGRLHLQASTCRPTLVEARQSSTHRCCHNAAGFLTPSGAPALAGRLMARLHAKVSTDCAMKGEWRKALRHTHGDPPRAALLACLGNPGAFARANFRRAARLRGGSRGPGMRCDSRAIRQDARASAIHRAASHLGPPADASGGESGGFQCVRSDSDFPWLQATVSRAMNGPGAGELISRYLGDL